MKASKADQTTIAKLAAFALSCHEELVRSGKHINELPPQIIAMADLLGMPVWDLLEIGQKANREKSEPVHPLEKDAV